MSGSKNTFFKWLKKSACVWYAAQQHLYKKKGNLERHYLTNHKKYESDFPAKSEQRKIQLQKLKNNLQKEQSIFTRPIIQSKAATIALFRISFVLAKHKKAFEDGEMLKEAFMEGGEALFVNFNKKSVIMSAIKDMQLSRQSVTRRVECMGIDLVQQLNKWY